MSNEHHRITGEFCESNLRQTERFELISCNIVCIASTFSIILTLQKVPTFPDFIMILNSHLSCVVPLPFSEAMVIIKLLSSTFLW